MDIGVDESEEKVAADDTLEDELEIIIFAEDILVEKEVEDEADKNEELVADENEPLIVEESLVITVHGKSKISTNTCKKLSSEVEAAVAHKKNVSAEAA